MEQSLLQEDDLSIINHPLLANFKKVGINKQTTASLNDLFNIEA